VLSTARADDLLQLPLQDTDLLLHEAGFPPIHTPVEVLERLPQRVKDRLYVVHTSALREGCELRVAPTGTAGTIRLDGVEELSDYDGFSRLAKSNSYSSLDNIRRESHLESPPRVESTAEPPLVALRPTSSSDPWFTLNLLSAVPFLSSLSYASTMEVLEAAKVDTFCTYDVVVPVSRRNEVLCVIWEGMCMERARSSYVEAKKASKPGRRISTFQVDQGRHRPISPFSLKDIETVHRRDEAIWYAGDWTGPRSLQPSKSLSGESDFSMTRDIVAMSPEGVKVSS